MKYEVSKEFIMQAYKDACTGWKNKIESEFPDLFKAKLVNGNWYWHPDNTGFLMCWSGNYGESDSYGINHAGEWSNILHSYKSYNYIQATDKEVEEMLINEAKKRGFVEGVKYISAWNDVVCEYSKNLIYDSVKNCLSGYNGNNCIFQNGKWATIIEQHKEMTLSEIEEKLGYKIKIKS